MNCGSNRDPSRKPVYGAPLVSNTCGNGFHVLMLRTSDAGNPAVECDGCGEIDAADDDPFLHHPCNRDCICNRRCAAGTGTWRSILYVCFACGGNGMLCGVSKLTASWNWIKNKKEIPEVDKLLGFFNAGSGT